MTHWEINLYVIRQQASKRDFLEHSYEILFYSSLTQSVIKGNTLTNGKWDFTRIKCDWNNRDTVEVFA